ncbi:MAG: hypothetical protein OXG13_19935 [Gemmatimonadaceae bacterium]|nr:hypothetical protein [Gemmatimonadaceae bacterium]
MPATAAQEKRTTGSAGSKRPRLIVLGAARRPTTRSGKRPLQVARLDCRHLKEG